MADTRVHPAPTTAGLMASVSAATLGAALLVRALTGRDSLLGLAHLAWLGAGVLLVGAVFAATTTLSAGSRPPTRLAAAVVWGTAGLLLAGSCFLLLQLIELAVTGTVTDWPAFAQRLCLLVVGALFVATAVTWRQRTAGHCLRCGRSHAPGDVPLVRPSPVAAPRSVQWTAYAGCAAFAPYLAVHGFHAAGYLPSLDELYTDSNPAASSVVVLLGFAIGLIGPAVVLALALVRPWGMVFPRWTLSLAGRRVPRFLPLAAVWLAAPTLALYGVGSVIYAVVAGYEIIGLGGAASLAFGGYGWALTIAAVSYQRRTRLRCVVR